MSLGWTKTRTMVHEDLRVKSWFLDGVNTKSGNSQSEYQFQSVLALTCLFIIIIIINVIIIIVITAICF